MAHILSSCFKSVILFQENITQGFSHDLILLDFYIVTFVVITYKLEQIFCIAFIKGSNIFLQTSQYLSRIMNRSVYQARAKLGRLRGALAFDELRRYQTRPSQFNWAPKRFILE